MKADTKNDFSKSGISTIVGAAMAILILITYFSGVYLWTASVQREMKQLDWEREQEEFEVYVVHSPETEKIISVVHNMCAIRIKIIRFWVINEDLHESYDLSIVIATWDDQVVMEDLYEVTGLTYTELLNCQFKVATERGNIKTTILIPVVES